MSAVLKVSPIAQDLRNFHPDAHQEPTVILPPSKRDRYYAGIGIVLLLMYGFMGEQDYQEAKRQEAEYIVLSHPLRGENCDISITQRGAGKWSPEKCAKGRIHGR